MSCYIIVILGFHNRIRKTFKNIPINILGHKEKSYKRDGLVKTIRYVDRYKDPRD